MFALDKYWPTFGGHIFTCSSSLKTFQCRPIDPKSLLINLKSIGNILLTHSLRAFYDQDHRYPQAAVVAYVNAPSR